MASPTDRYLKFPPARILRYLLVGFLVVTLAAVAVLGVSSSAQAQEDEGDGGLVTDPTTSEQVEPAVSEEADDSAEGTVRKVMFGLIAVAVLLTALTIYYWWITRPEPPARQSAHRYVRRDRSEGESSGTVKPWQTDST